MSKVASVSVDDLVQVSAGVEIVLEGHRPLAGGDHVDVLLLRSPAHTISVAAMSAKLALLPDPVRKLLRVWNCGREQDDVDMIRQHDDNFFPDDTALV